MEIVSPCTGVCQLDDKDYCLGCLRHRDEIGGWLNFDNTQRMEIVQKLKQRRRALGRTSVHDAKPRRRNRNR